MDSKLIDNYLDKTALKLIVLTVQYDTSSTFVAANVNFCASYNMGHMCGS